MLHPAGNVAEFLVPAGLAHIVDWHAGILVSSGGEKYWQRASLTTQPDAQSDSSSFPYVHVYRINHSTRLSDPRQAYFAHLSLSPGISVRNRGYWSVGSARFQL